MSYVKVTIWSSPALPKRIKNESMMSHTSIFHSKKQYHHTSRMQHPPSKHHALLRVNHYKVKSICICLISPIWVPLNDPWFPPLPHRWHNPQAFIVTIMLQRRSPACRWSHHHAARTWTWESPWRKTQEGSQPKIDKARGKMNPWGSKTIKIIATPICDNWNSWT